MALDVIKLVFLFKKLDSDHLLLPIVSGKVIKCIDIRKREGIRETAEGLRLVEGFPLILEGGN